jgi:hypothetical protein
VKVQLLYLDSHDDQVSVRDKMGWVKAPRLLVVWPRRGRGLCTPLDLALIKRAAERKGAQIGLVTFDPDVRDHAQDLGIPVFDSVDSTPETIWRAAESTGSDWEKSTPDRSRLEDRPRRFPASPSQLSRRGSVGRWAAFAVGVAALAALAATLGPSATVVITPETQVLQARFQVQLDPAVDTLTASNHIPADRHTVSVSGELRVPASGRVSVPSSPAEGTVVFTNLGQDSITVPKGTGVRADTQAQPRFVTLVPVTLEGKPGSEATVAVRAAQDGSDGNVPADAIVSIDGPLGLQVAVTNPEPTLGGGDTSKPAVAPYDLRRLEESLQAKLVDEASTAIENQVGEGEAWAASSLHIDRTVEKAFDAQVGDVAQSVSLTMTLEVSGLVYHTQTVTAAAAQALEARQPSDMVPIPNSVTSQSISVDGVPNRLTVAAQEIIYEELPKSDIVRTVAGVSPSSVAALVDSRFGVHSAVVILRPSWFPRVPWLPQRIHVVYPWEGR